VEIESRRNIESEELAKRIARQASLEVSFRGGQVSTSGCRAIEEEEEEDDDDGKDDDDRLYRPPPPLSVYKHTNIRVYSFFIQDLCSQ
jgi:hypothetical protein